LLRKVVELARETLGKRDVVRIHTRYELTMTLFKPKIKCCNDAPAGAFENLQACVVMVQRIHGTISAVVINQQQFKIFKGLRQNTADRLAEESATVTDRNYNGYLWFQRCGRFGWMSVASFNRLALPSQRGNAPGKPEKWVTLSG
jgi:hypothetical protein